MKYSRHVLGSILLFSGTLCYGQGEDFTYHRQFEDQMGTEAPEAQNLREAIATAAGGAVCANRNASEFSTVT